LAVWCLAVPHTRIPAKLQLLYQTPVFQQVRAAIRCRDAAEEVFEEYLDSKSLRVNEHHKALQTSSGLLELHYDTMRKRQKDRASRPAFIHGPTMDRPYAACSNYGGFIPGKLSNNIVGCSWGHGSRIAHEVRGKHFDPPMSGVTYTFGGKSASSPSLHQEMASSGGSASHPFRVTPPKLDLNGVQQ